MKLFMAMLFTTSFAFAQRGEISATDKDYEQMKASIHFADSLLGFRRLVCVRAAAAAAALAFQEDARLAGNDVPDQVKVKDLYVLPQGSFNIIVSKNKLITWGTQYPVSTTQTATGCRAVIADD